MDNLQNIVEAILFASGVPVRRSEILEKMPDEVSRKDLDNVIDKIAKKYSGDSGIVLQIFNDKIQFASNANYSDIVSDILQPVKEKELSTNLMQVLSLVAYFQPITRSEIEDCRGGQSADYALMMLMKSDLIESKGVKMTPGRPILYGTTDNFLKRFELRSLEDLPDLEEVKRDMYEGGKYHKFKSSLYREDGDIDENEPKSFADKVEEDKENEEDLLSVIIPDEYDIPDFIDDKEGYEIVDGDSEGEMNEIVDIKDENSTDVNDGGEITI